MLCADLAVQWVTAVHSGRANLEGEVSELHVLCENVEHAHHLGEDEYAMAGLPQPHQELVQQVQLPTATNEGLCV